MFLSGNLISLRALEPSDAEILYRWENNRDIWPVSFTQIPFSKFILEEFTNASHADIYTNKQLRLMVNKLNSNDTIGMIDLFDFDAQHQRSGLGIYIYETFRKSGCALECVELIKDYCFKTLLLKQLFVHINESNPASVALFEKAGFEKSGLKKSWTKTGLNSYEDVWFMQCINKGA
ncbi:GNAT family N-acetyltransferase [Aurantibacillus circumpalustris]|uniref:GNAT family N-acetyltransferase n=1 Tax=Aurantibacillus circumpalustris TaxID=3036359 RepID=UPI00295A73B7|nr:GNAT family N-acetyltransferase [Aurantibacillus circumpalustris]